MSPKARCPLCLETPTHLLLQYTTIQAVGICPICTTVSVVRLRDNGDTQEDYSKLINIWNDVFTFESTINEEPAYAQVIPPSSNTFYISLSLNISPEQSK